MADEAKVFILTGEWQDVQKGNTLRFMGISDSGMPVEFIIDNVRPVFFIDREQSPLNLPVSFNRREVKLKSFDFKDVDALYFRTQKDLRTAAESLSLQGVTTYESDVDPVRRFLMERFIYAQIKLTGESSSGGGILRFVNPKVEPSEFDPKFRVASIDIETGIQDGRLYSIAVDVSGRSNEKAVFMLDDDAPPAAEDLNGQLRLFKTEKELLRSFISWFKSLDPDIIIGWHVIGFDLMFLENKARELNLSFDISRGGKVSLGTRKMGSYYAYVPGRVVLDGPPSLRAAFYSFEDYKLETVSQELLGKGKTISPESDKVGEIERFFSQDKTKLAEYNLKDAELVTEIFSKTGLIDLCVRRSQISGLFMDQLSRMTQAFDNFYLPRLHRSGLVAPNGGISPAIDENLSGGYVIDPKPGIYHDVIVMDYKSLYPSIIQTFRIDPLSMLHSDEDTIVTPGGYKFSSTKHILPDYIGSLMLQRTMAKRSKNKHLAQAIKILMNSFYGVMGASNCRFFHPYLPNAITGTGQWLLLESKKFFEEKGFTIVYGDTDSLFVKLKEGDGDKARELGQKLALEINEYWKKRLHEEFSLESFLEIEFEKHYKRFIITQARGSELGAKKRYAGLIETDGRRELEFTGMEIVRSDWTRLAKEFQEELYSRIFNSQDPGDWIRNFVEEVSRGVHDDKLIYRKRLRKDPDNYTKNTPPHVKAARLINATSGTINYVMTKRGPMPVELGQRDYDYEHYIDKQIKPIADSVLGLLGQSFDKLFKPTQLNFFS